MKKISLFLLCAFAVMIMRAVPADPTPVTVPQADGTSITLRLVGDEFYHYTTTTDGYTVVNNGGSWEYAVLKGDRVQASGVVAHNESQRSASEQAFVAGLKKCVTDRKAISSAVKMRSQRDHGAVDREPVIDYDKFRGLIVLINFTDRQFQMNDAYTFYNDMVNTQNFEGFNFAGRFNPCTGSVRDYFYDQSMGQFDPVFDVVGPVNVPFASTECGNQYSEVFRASLDAIDAQVDFTKYDADGDGGIDMVFFLVAGYAASYSGNSEEYLWPHMSYLYGFDPETHQWYVPEYDGMYMGRYASSTEIYGWESYGMTEPNGIGTICHEFGHVLGLPDLYDTDYGDQGQSFDPGEWDVMAGGSYGNRGRTPVGYSLWERTELGWATPVMLTEGSHELESIDKSNTGFRLNTPNEYEYFLFENRQNNKWDRSLPSHGMVVARVDHSNPRAWQNNEVNCNPEHNYYELLRASGSAVGTAFPGPSGVTSINSTTSPGLLTWAGEPCDASISNIAENSGIITFDLGPGISVNSIVEDFEMMEATPGMNEKNVEGRFSNWTFIQANVSEDAQLFNDGKGCVMNMPAGIEMEDDIYGDLYRVTVVATNPSSQESKLQLYYSLDKGANWKSAGIIQVPGNTHKEEYGWKFIHSEPLRLRLLRTAGSKSNSLYVDDFTIYFSGDLKPVPESVNGDIDGNGIVDVEDVNAAINIVLKTAGITDYPGDADLDGNGIVDIEDVNAIINIVLKIN